VTDPVSSDIRTAPDAWTDRRVNAVGHRLRSAARRHWLFLVVFVAGLALRVVAQLAYRPALLYIDSYRYLDLFRTLDPTLSQPIGYDVFVLRPVLWIGNLSLVPAVQHLLGLAMGALIYAVLVRRGVVRWLAALAAVPVLLDAYQVQIEQNVMTEAFFEALVLGGVALLLWNRRPRYGALAVAGLLLGTSTTVRVVGLPLVLVAAAYAMAQSDPGWRQRLKRGAIVTAAFLLPVLLYGAYYTAWSGDIGLTRTDANASYGRAATIVDCRGLQLPAYERPLCPKQPLGHRKGVDWYAHNRALRRVPLPKGVTLDAALRDFSRRVFVHQPLDFAHAVFVDFAKAFAWDRTTEPNDVPVERWQFQVHYPTFGFDPRAAGRTFGGGGPHVNTTLTRFLREYQLDVGFVPGPALGLMFLAGLLGGLGVGRARRSGLRAACLLPTLCGLVLLLASDAFEFSWRYQLPALVLAPLGAALGVTAMFGIEERERRRSGHSPVRGTEPPGEHAPSAAADLAEPGRRDDVTEVPAVHEVRSLVARSRGSSTHRRRTLLDAETVHDRPDQQFGGLVLLLV
jgi:hypothetical protein